MGMFGRLDVYEAQAVYGGTEIVDGVRADVLVLTTAEGLDSRLYVEAATSRALAITWMAPPIVMFSTTSIERRRVGSGELISQTPAGAALQASSPGAVSLPAAPTGDPTAGLGLVEHRLLFSNFKTENGITWPHDVKELSAGELIAETHFGKLHVNPKLDAQRFAPGRF